MRVLLLDVPFGADQIGGERELFAGVENVIPALGLAYLAAVAEQAGHDARILDCARGLGFDAIEREIRLFRPHVVGVGATTPTFGNAVRAAGIARSIVPNAALIAGGSHPTAMPEHAAAAGAFDYLVLGEGERAFAALLAYLDGGGDEPAHIPGVATVEGGGNGTPRPVFGPPARYEPELDSLPLPARHLLPPLSDYRPCPASLRRLPLAHVMTSRGCPSRCTFCDRAVFGERYREHSVERVLAEVEEVVSHHGAREVRFFDDTFTVHRRRAYAICDELKRSFPGLPWTSLTRVDAVDPDLLRTMREAGCWQVLFGLESGDDDVLASLGKRTTVAQNRQAVLWAREAGLRVRADFLVGSPAETPATLERTLALACELPLDFAHFNKFVPFPGTELYDTLTAAGHSFDFEASSTLAHDALVYVPPALDADAYRHFLDRSYRVFYGRPRYALRRLTALRTWTELRVNAAGSRAIAKF